MDALYAVLGSVLLFFAGWGIAFVISMIRAPSALDFECQEQMRAVLDKAEQERWVADTKLKVLQMEVARKRPVDEVKEKEVKTWLSVFSEAEKKFLAWLLRQGETEDFRLRNCGLPDGVVKGALNKGLRKGLIIDTKVSITQRNYLINPSYAGALTNVLYPW